MKAGNWLLPVSRNGPPAAAAAAQAPMPAVAPATAAATAAVGGTLDPISYGILWANTNPYIIGMFMLLLNLGGRFLTLELTKKQEAFLQGPYIRPLIFFTVIFIATRNLVVAFWVTLLFFFVIWVVANEHSRFCLIPGWCTHADAATPPAQSDEAYEANIKKLAASQTQLSGF
jgi:hypothetical protein